MLAPPIAALVGIGVVSMWELYKEGGWKSWILPGALIVDGLVQLLILSYYYETFSIAKILMITVSILCFVSSILLIIANLNKNWNAKLKKILVVTALMGLLITSTAWSTTTMFYTMSGTFPSAGLSLISSASKEISNTTTSSSSSKLIEFLTSHKTTEKYILLTSSTSGDAADIIIKTGESVMTWGFFGTDKAITLAEFQELVSKGEVRYVMVGGQGGGSSNDIMTWVAKVGTIVPESEWKDSTTSTTQTTRMTKTTDTASTAISNEKSTDANIQQVGGFGGKNSGQLYDLKTYADSIVKK